MYLIVYFNDRGKRMASVFKSWRNANPNPTEPSSRRKKDFEGLLELPAPVQSKTKKIAKTAERKKKPSKKKKGTCL